MSKKQKFKERAKGFVLGALLMALIPTVVVFAAPQLVEIFFSVNAITLDGEVVQLAADEQPFTLEGRTFVPVAAIGRALGLEVRWEGATQTVHLTSSAPAQITPPIATLPTTHLVDTIGNHTGLGANDNNNNPRAITNLRPGNIVYRTNNRNQSDRVAMSQHNLGGNYSTLTTQIAHVPGSRLNDVTFVFNGDGRTLATVTRTQHQTLPYSVMVDVSGVSLLTITVTAAVGSFGPTVSTAGNPIGAAATAGWELISPTLTR